MMTCPKMIGMDIARRHLLQGYGIGEHRLGLAIFIAGGIDLQLRRTRPFLVVILEEADEQLHRFAAFKLHGGAHDTR